MDDGDFGGGAGICVFKVSLIVLEIENTMKREKDH
jgi:hypothetical protein